jgi:hypothetical protein
MKTKNFNSESLEYFLSLAKGIIPESKDLLFDIMAETARAENLTDHYKEERIYLVSHLHRLLSGIENEISEAD